MMLYNIVESRSAKLGLACLESLAPAFQCNVVDLGLLHQATTYLNSYKHNFESFTRSASIWQVDAAISFQIRG